MTTNPDQTPKSSAGEKKLHQAMREIAKLLGTAEGHDKAIDKIISFRGVGRIARFTLLQLVIAAGQEAGNRQLTQIGLDTFDRLKAKLPSDDTMLYYNVANGYHELYAFQRQDGASIFDCEGTITSVLK